MSATPLPFKKPVFEEDDILLETDIRDTIPCPPPPEMLEAEGPLLPDADSWA